MCLCFLLLSLQQEAPGCCSEFQRLAERPRTPADPAEIHRAQEEAGPRRWWQRQEPGFVCLHARHGEHRLPVQPAFLLPQLFDARQLGWHE